MQPLPPDSPSLSMSSPDRMSDVQLVEAVLRKEGPAQRALYERFARKMFGICLRYAGSREEAEDLLQDGFIRVFERISSFKAEGSLEGWVRKVMVNTALEHLRRQSMQWITGLEGIDEPAGQPEIEGELDFKAILGLIQDLPTGFRVVFNLHAVEGYNHREIAELLGITEGTSKSQYARARAKLCSSYLEQSGKK